MVGRDSASSAQSKCVDSGETAGSELGWGGLGQTGSERGARGGQGAFAGADGVIGDAGRVYQMVWGETVRLGGFWGERGS